jgi:hypothetical protein
MENQRFDAIVRRLTSTTSRRRALVGGLAGAMAALTGTAFSGDVADAKKGGNGKSKGHQKGKQKAKGKTSFCHQTGNGSFTFITVSQSARKAHLGHGDVECTPDPCRTYTGSCTQTPTTRVCDFTPVAGCV